MGVKKKSYRHEKRVENFNDDLLDYIVHSVYDLPEDDEPRVLRIAPYAEIIQGAKTRREARNRLIAAARENGSGFFDDAIIDYNNDFGNDEAGIVYNNDSFDIDKLKAAPILAKEMDLGDVNSYVDKLAKLMGYTDNGTADGAITSLLKDFYGDGFLANFSGGHSGDYSFYKENRALADALKEKFGSIVGLETLKRELGYNPEISEDDLFNVDKGIPSFTQRAFRAKARKGDKLNTAISFLEGLVGAQSSGALDEGKTPGIVDVGTDIAEAALLGPAKTGKAILKTPLKAVGFETGLDVLHDALKDKFEKKVYSEGDRPSVESGNIDLKIKDRLPDIVQAAVLGRVGGRMQRGIERKLDNLKLDRAIKNEEIYERLGDLAMQKKNIQKDLKEINDIRKKSGLDIILESDYRKELDNRVKDAERTLIQNNKKNAMDALINGSLRIGTARGLYNPQSSPAVAKTALELIYGKK